MASMVAELYAKLSLRPDRSSWAKGQKAISGLQAGIAAAGAAVLGFFGARAAGKAFISFNANVEETKNQIAGMLALTKKTSLTDELSNADTLFKNLQRRAATLPGTTQEYTRMLGMLAQPITAAGLGMQDLEDLTVDSVVAAKGLGISWDVAARDIDQALRGQFHAVDQFTGKLLASQFGGEEGRRKFNQLSKKQRAEILKAALEQPQIKQLGEAQGATFEGRLSTLQDSLQRFAGRVGAPLFDFLKEKLIVINDWLAKNEGRVNEWADIIGGKLKSAAETVFNFIIKAGEWIAEHWDDIRLVFGLIAKAFKIAFAVAQRILPIVFRLIVSIAKALLWVGAKIGDVISAFMDFGGWVTSTAEGVKKAFTDAWDFVKNKAEDTFNYIRNLPVVKQIIDAVTWVKDRVASEEDVKQITNDVRKRALESDVPWLRAIAPPQAMLSPDATGGPTASLGAKQVNVGGINIKIDAPGGDPVEMQRMMKAQIEDHLSTALLQTAEAVG